MFSSMRVSFLCVLASLATACAARPARQDAPLVAANGTASTRSDPAKARRVPGLDRFDRVALLEANILCGTRAGRHPVCATDENPRFAEPYERLDDVVALEALNDVHCVLFGNGALDCVRRTDGWPFPVARPERWSRMANDVADFVIVASSGPYPVVAVTRHGDVLGLFPPGELETPSRAPREGAVVAATGVRAIASTGVVPCAITNDQRLECLTSHSPEAGFHVMDNVRPSSLFYGGIAIDMHGRVWENELGADYLPTGFHESPRFDRDGARDYAPQGGCFLDARGSIDCDGITHGKVTIDLPARAKRVAPRGDVMCAKLIDETTACWGPFIANVERLGAREVTAPRMLVEASR